MNKSAIFLFFGLASAALPSTATDVSDLLRNSPFVPQGWSPAGGRSQAGEQPYVFKGVYGDGADVHVNIADGATGKGRWIMLGETVDNIRVVTFDAAARRVTIVASGQEITLEMPKPSNQASQLGMAVNSVGPGQRPVVQAPRVGANRRALRPMAPPPGWAVNGPGQRRTDIALRGGSSGSSESGGTDTPDPDPGTDTPDPDPGTDTPVTAPPSPPNFVPTIPAELQEMIDSGASPDR